MQANFMQRIGCKICGGSHIGFGEVSVNVVLSKSTCCEHCSNTQTDKQDIFFCSLACFNAFMLRVASGSESVEWQGYGFGTGGAIDK